MINAALEYLDQGFSVIPCKGKKALINWQEFQTRLPTEQEVEAWWGKWSDANIAIVCGKVSGVLCVDADGEDGIKWMRENLPRTTVYSITAKGLHAIYRVPEGNVVIRNRVRLAPQVDIRGEGGYFIAPPSVHETGHQYKWHFELNGWDDIVEYQPSSGNLNLNLSMIKPAPINASVSKGERNQTLAGLAGKWIGAGLDDEEVVLLAKAWNTNNSPPLCEKELLTTIRSIRKTHNRNHPSATPEIKQANIKEKSTIPESLMNPGGVLQDLMDYIDQSSAASVPWFALGGAIAFLGNILGMKVETHTGLKTNMYCICIGYSGAGKNAPFRTLPALLLKTDASASMGATDITSGAAIQKYVSNPEKRIVLMMFDELGDLLEGMKNPNSPKRSIPAILKHFFSNPEQPDEKGYASDTQFSPWRHLSFYGAAAPEGFWGSLSSGDLTDGFIARALIFESLHDAPYPKDNIEKKIPKHMIRQINSLWNIKTEFKGGNLINLPVSHRIYRTDQACEFFEPWRKKYFDLKNKNKLDECVSSIYGRAAEHADKLALIHAMSLSGPGCKNVGVHSIEWACSLIDYIIPYTIKQIGENVAENEVARIKQKIIKGIKRYTVKNREKFLGATRRDLQVGGPGRGLKSKELQEYLDSLIDAGLIGVNNYKAKNGREVSFYYVAEQKDE